MILHAALRTVRGQLAAGHGDERSVRAVDDLQVTHDKAVVKRDRAERLEALARFFHELDANLSDFHGRSPCAIARPTDNCEWRRRAQVGAPSEKLPSAAPL